MQLTRTHRILIGLVVAGAVLIAAIGFAGSYAAVRELAEEKGFGQFSLVFPIGIDAGICVLLALDLLLTWMRIPFPLLRQTAWLLTAATIAFNGAAAWPDPLGTGMHAVIPILFVVAVEAARHAVGRIADITADKHMEGVRLTRWLLSPVPTFKLWRRMKLWELRSYEQVIKLEQDRLIYQARLQARFGRNWRRKAPIESLMPLRLAKYGVPLADTAASGLAAAGIEPALLPPDPQSGAAADGAPGLAAADGTPALTAGTRDREAAAERLRSGDREHGPEGAQEHPQGGAEDQEHPQGGAEDQEQRYEVPASWQQRHPQDPALAGGRDGQAAQAGAPVQGPYTQRQHAELQARQEHFEQQRQRFFQQQAQQAAAQAQAQQFAGQQAGQQPQQPQSVVQGPAAPQGGGEEVPQDGTSPWFAAPQVLPAAYGGGYDPAYTEEPDPGRVRVPSGPGGRTRPLGHAGAADGVQAARPAAPEPARPVREQPARDAREPVPDDEAQAAEWARQDAAYETAAYEEYRTLARDGVPSVEVLDIHIQDRHGLHHPRGTALLRKLMPAFKTRHQAEMAEDHIA